MAGIIHYGALTYITMQCMSLYHLLGQLPFLLHFYRIVEIIITVSPVGLLKSNVTASTTPQQWFVDVTWTPTSSQIGQNILCYYAENSVW